jgi:hypothetical protein
MKPGFSARIGVYEKEKILCTWALRVDAQPPFRDHGTVKIVFWQSIVRGAAVL